jgi:hypothetical protein
LTQKVLLTQRVVAKRRRIVLKNSSLTFFIGKDSLTREDGRLLENG